MKKSMLWGALVAVISTPIAAQVPQAPVKTPTPNPAINTTQSIVQKTTGLPPRAIPEPVINCDYKIAKNTKTIDSSLVLKWSEKAIMQSFDFDSKTLDAQMQKLKSCFTGSGWTGFNSALEQSGNLNAIRTHQLHVHGHIDGQPTVSAARDNQWKISLPLSVVYQNANEKVTQQLNIDVIIARKNSGNLGIAQMVTMPRMPGVKSTGTPAPGVPVSTPSHP